MTRTSPTLSITLTPAALQILDEARERLEETRSKKLDAIVREWAETKRGKK